LAYDSTPPAFDVFDKGDEVTFKVLDVDGKKSPNTNNAYMNLKLSLKHADGRSGTSYDSLTMTVPATWKHAQLFLALGYIKPDAELSRNKIIELYDRLVDDENNSGVCVMATPDVDKNDPDKKYNAVDFYKEKKSLI
jgi:hypothetical protein